MSVLPQDEAMALSESKAKIKRKFNQSKAAVSNYAKKLS